ncbi:hypothetical protein [Roseateles puraquae]|uniref:Uncharacterized protein n=1 Tax=Roseateles puraquae TaxID=431059 RepID=A0A254NB31_9BURK|nr:hypothetical protein [Roseateles puraquae]MDG0852208.1 hypothetical protein [Roseateles puraquae]OWR04072.1 hypothetical protein CDO81_10135 [Roseateles puraquae]
MNGADPGSTGITFVNVRDAPAAQDEPNMEVQSWRLIKAPSGELHLGTLRAPQPGRAVVRLTSALAAFDMAASAVTTASGRRYVLMGPPESRSLECMAIRNGAAQLGLAAGIDISAQFWAQMHEASGGCDCNSRG